MLFLVFTKRTIWQDLPAGLYLQDVQPVPVLLAITAQTNLRTTKIITEMAAKGSQTPFEGPCTFRQFLSKLLISTSIFFLPRLKKARVRKQCFVFATFMSSSASTYDNWPEKLFSNTNGERTISDSIDLCRDSQLHFYLWETRGQYHQKWRYSNKSSWYPYPKPPKPSKLVKQRSNSVTRTRCSALQKGCHQHFAIISVQNNDEKAQCTSHTQHKSKLRESTESFSKHFPNCNT